MSLFDDASGHVGLPYAVGSDTSKAAAESALKWAPQDRERVWKYIELVGGATCDEVEAALGMSHQTTSARIYDLVHAKPMARLMKTATKRRTRGGQLAHVYEVVKL